MDALTFMVASAHLKVRVERLSRHPELWRFGMTPTFKGLGSALAKLKHDLDIQAAPLMADIESLGQEAPQLLKQAQQEVAKTKQAVADIKEFVSGLIGDNGGPSLEASSVSSGEPASTVSSAAPASEPVMEAPAASTAPEHLSVNGVSQG